MTSKKNFIVAGPENSGTQWVTEIISHHPEVNPPMHRSFPYGYFGSTDLPHPGRYWPDFQDVKQQIGDPDTCLIIVCRDEFFTRCSNVLTTEYAFRDPPADPPHAIKIIKEQIANWEGKYLIVSYETLLQWREVYIKQILQHFDLRVSNYPFDRVRYNNGNKKYVKEQWGKLII